MAATGAHRLSASEYSKDPPPTGTPARFLHLPVEIRTLVLREVWPRAVHIEASPGRPDAFRHYFCGLGRDLTNRDARKPGCMALLSNSFYEKVYEENVELKTWDADHCSRWRNHWVCEWSVKKIGKGQTLLPQQSDDFPPSDFLPVLLTCKQLYSEAITIIGRDTNFSFTDLWTPVEFFAGSKAPPVSRRVSVINLSANPFVPPQTDLWKQFLQLLPRFPHLREVNMWLELTQPVPNLPADGGEEFEFVRDSLSQAELAAGSPLRLRVSVPLDGIKAAENITEPPPSSVREQATGEERLPNGCVILRRGRVYKPDGHSDGIGTCNEWGGAPICTAPEYWQPAHPTCI